MADKYNDGGEAAALAMELENPWGGAYLCRFLTLSTLLAPIGDQIPDSRFQTPDSQAPVLYGMAVPPDIFKAIPIRCRPTDIVVDMRIAPPCLGGFSTQPVHLSGATPTVRIHRRSTRNVCKHESYPFRVFATAHQMTDVLKVCGESVPVVFFDGRARLESHYYYYRHRAVGRGD